MPTGDRRQGVGGLVLELGGSRFYLPVDAVVEVLRDAPIARIPGADGVVRGIANHRGRIITVADAGRALRLRDTAAEGGDVVVAEHGDHRFGVVVDRVVELTADARTGLATLDLEGIATAIFG